MEAKNDDPRGVPQQGASSGDKRIEGATPPLRFAIVTPSYYVDFERCKFLVETTERYVASHVKHYVVVDRSDQKLFAPLASSRTHVVLKEDVLGDRLRQVP